MSDAQGVTAPPSSRYLGTGYPPRSWCFTPNEYAESTGWHSPVERLAHSISARVNERGSIAVVHEEGPRPKPHASRPMTMEVSATCWCERKIVGVTLADVRLGRTRSCGHRDCHPA